MVAAKINPSHEVNIAFVGKYTELKDSYKSLNEALEHAGIKNKTKVNIVFVEAENINASNAKKSELIQIIGKSKAEKIFK